MKRNLKRWLALFMAVLMVSSTVRCAARPQASIVLELESGLSR